MPQSTAPLPRSDLDRAPACPAVPPAPEPVDAAQPAPRVVYEDGGGNAPWLRLVAIDWTDRDLVTYQVQVARGHSWWAPGDGMLWAPASGEEREQMFFALAAQVDARQQAAARAQERGR